MGMKHEFRAASEERHSDNNHRSMFQNLKKMSSNYDNYANSPSNSPQNPRKSSNSNKFWSKSPTSHRQKQFNTIAAVDSRETSPFLYDRRLNKSFETPESFMDDKEKFSNEKGLKSSIFRRSSTPQLHNIHCDAGGHDNVRDSMNSTWCCGNFVVKQWKKMNQHY